MRALFLLSLLICTVGCGGKSTSPVGSSREVKGTELVAGTAAGIDDAAFFQATRGAMRNCLSAPITKMLIGKDPLYVAAIKERINEAPGRFVQILRIEQKKVTDGHTSITALVRLDSSGLHDEVTMQLRSMRVARMPRIMLRITGGASRSTTDAQIITKTIQAALLKKEYPVIIAEPEQLGDAPTASKLGAEFIMDTTITMSGMLHLALCDVSDGKVVFQKSSDAVSNKNAAAMSVAATLLANDTIDRLSKIWRVGSTRDVKISVSGVSFAEHVRLTREIKIQQGVLSSSAGAFTEDGAIIDITTSQDAILLADSLTRLGSTALKVIEPGLNILLLEKSR